jgi:probable HAF family extracellular repeat protein
VQSSAQTATIEFVPDLPGGGAFSIAYAATPDGQYVVGYSGSSQGSQAYRWNRSTGQMDAMGFLANAGFYRSKAFAVSDDGNIVVGRSDTSDPGHPIPRAFKWTPTTGMVALPYASTNHLLGPQGNTAVSVSADGATIVGRFETYATGVDGLSYYPAQMHQWCSWTSSGVQLVTVSGQPAPLCGQVGAVSADGSRIVGFTGDPAQPDAVNGTVVAGGTATGLGSLPGGRNLTEPTAISRDSTTIVGAADTLDPDGTIRFHAFRWQQGTGITDLGRLPGVPGPSRATGVSQDGSVVVGTQAQHALIWDATNGMRDLTTVLTSNFGVNLQGKVLLEATWISPDGTWIVGNAATPGGPTTTVGWIAHLQ